MGYVLVLALALLQALTGSVPSHRCEGWLEASRAPMVRAIHSAPDGEAVVRAPGSLYQGLRIARVITSAPLDRTIGSASGGGLRDPASITGLQALQWRNALRRATRPAFATRAIASRGSLLPYFPTAPPLAG